MNDKKAKRGFTQLSRMYYGKDLLKREDYVDEILFGYYYPCGGTEGEMVVKWIYLAGMLVPRLEIFSDAWKTLFKMQDLLKKMAEIDGTDPSPEEFCKLLLSCGFEDLTKTSLGNKVYGIDESMLDSYYGW